MLHLPSTRVLMTCGAIGISGTILVSPLTWLTVALYAIPFAHALVVGIYTIPPIIAIALIRKPGIALITMLLTALISAPLSPIGWGLIPALLAIAIAIEMPLILFLYKIWHKILYILGGVLGSLAQGIGLSAVARLWEFPTYIQISVWSTIILSGITCSTLALIIVNKIAKSGVQIL